MANDFKFYRSFLIFEKEDGGFGCGQEPSGHVRIEVREAKGKLSVSIQNLREDAGKINYNVYILKHDGKDVCPVHIGALPVKKNRGELQWDFDPGSVGNSGYPITDFNVAVVLAQHGAGLNGELLCPLAAYKSAKVKWRDGFRSAMLTDLGKKQDDTDRKPDAEIVKDRDVTSKYEGRVESKYDKPVEEPEAEASEMSEEKQPISEKRDVVKDMYLDILSSQNDKVSQDELQGFNDTADRQTDAEASKASGQENIVENTAAQNINADMNNDDASLRKQPSNSWFNPYSDCSSCANQSGCTVQRETRAENNTIQEGARGPETSDLDKFKKNLDKYFQQSNPFNNKRRDYKWWKVNSPVYLNNILYHCNIKTPLLFNPQVMMAHFKYRHLIVGIFIHRVKNKEYIVCGIPAVYNIDEKPFGDMCRWVQLEGARPRYGAFGYWLVYIDPLNGGFLNIN